MEDHGLKIRDLRAKDKFIVDDLFVDEVAGKVGIYAAGVYLSFCRHADRLQACWPSVQTIAEELGISDRQVIRSIKILENFGLVRKVRLGKTLTNRYFLLDKSEWGEMTNSHITQGQQNSQSEVPNSHFIGDCQSLLKCLPVTSNIVRKHNSKEREKDAFEIFNYWNSKNIVIHKEFSRFKTHIDARLKYYSLEELKQAINNYSLVFKGEAYWWSHRWGLDQLLVRKSGLDRFIPANFKPEDYLNGHRKSSVSRPAKGADELKQKIKEWEKDVKTHGRHRGGDPVAVGGVLG